MNIKSLNSFLKLGYFLDYKHDCKMDFSNVDKKNFKDYDESELIEIGIDTLKQAFSKRFNLNKKHVVPLSGGLDSRAILACLLEFTESKNIITYTFGSPGSLDYDIGNYISKKLGTNHITIPLNNYEYKIEDLLQVSKMVKHQTVLFHHPPLEIINQLNEYEIWSGFMGDPLAGSHLGRNYKDINGAKENFLIENTYVKSTKLTNLDNKELYDLIDNPNYDIHQITLKEQLDFENRQLKFIAPHVLMKGFNYITPFLDQKWINFILSIDNKYRKDQFLYKKILFNAFPESFSLKTKNNFGLPINAKKPLVLLFRTHNSMKRILNKRLPFIANPFVNYIDFSRGIRERSDLKKIVKENVLDLERRRIIDWINISEILNNHLNNNKDYSDALLVLTSLEIHLKAKQLFNT